MNDKMIHQLVERFMQGETTDSEEQMLYRAFRSGDVPDDLRHLTDMFIGLDLVREPIPAAPSQTKARRIVWWKIASAAAAVALVIFGAWMMFGKENASEQPQQIIAARHIDKPKQETTEEQPINVQPEPQMIAQATPRKAAAKLRPSKSVSISEPNAQTPSPDEEGRDVIEQYRREQQEMIAEFGHSPSYDETVQDIRQRGDLIMGRALAICATNGYSDI